jgi:8-oxo-dGTP pyrophosphatase MutT (NUDIX family)
LQATNRHQKIQRITVAAFIVRPDGMFLVGERSPDEKFLPGYFEPIGGGSNWGEEPVDALLREVKEESGLEVSVDVPLSTITYTEQNVHCVMIVFLCTPIGDSIPTPSIEHSRLFWTSISQLRLYQTDYFMDKVVADSIAHLKRLGISVKE